jgi:hypothetical protein
MISRREFSSAAFTALATVAAGDAAADAPQQPAAAAAAPAPLKSEFLMDVILDVAAPHNLGARLIVPVTGGTFEGPKLKGTALAGGDWIQVRPDGASELNVRVTLKTDDEQLIYMTYRGLLYTPKGGEQYWRTTPVFETGSAKYDWLTRIIAVGVGRRVPNKAAYSIYQIL